MVGGALAELRGEWPDAGWQLSYMGDDVLIGIVQGAPIVVWRPGGQGPWRAKAHYGGHESHRDHVYPVEAVRAWLRWTEAVIRHELANRRPKLAARHG